MKKIEFRSYNGGYCAFTGDSIMVADSTLKEIKVYPFGSINKLSSVFGMRIKTFSGETAFFSFLHMHKKNKKRIKALVNDVKEKLGSFDRAEPYIIEIDEAKKEKIEKIRKPHLSKKKLIRFWISFALVIIALLIIISLVVGLSGAEGFNPTGNEVKFSWKDLW